MPEILIFFISVSIIIFASLLLFYSIIKVGSFFNLTQKMMGFIFALAADAAEIASAFVAFHLNQHDLGFGIILGSNVFNLASLLGLSAVVLGTLKMKRQALWSTGILSLLAAGVSILQVTGIVSPLAALFVLIAALAPYLYFLFSSRESIEIGDLTIPLHPFLSQAFNVENYTRTKIRSKKTLFVSILLAFLALFLIFTSCVGLILSSVQLGILWNIPTVILGILIIAALTSIPNMITTLSFALRNHQRAVVNESFNSNTLNILLGTTLPGAIYGMKMISPQTIFCSYWLLGMTACAIIFGIIYQGISRKIGAFLIGLYVVFAAILISNFYNLRPSLKPVLPMSKEQKTGS